MWNGVMGKLRSWGGTATVEMNIGDVFVVETPGGGGNSELRS